MARDYRKSNDKRTALENAYSDLDIFFNRHPVTKDITTKTDAEAVKRSVRNIVLTNYFERVFKPSFGTNLSSALFELNTREVGSRVGKDIVESLQKLEPRINNIKIVASDQDLDSNRREITIYYNIINGLQKQQVNLTVNRVR